MRVRLLTDWRYQIGLLFLLAVIFSAANWLKLGTFWGDAPRSLFEMYRASTGAIPYRDFTFQYPPLPIAAFGLMLHWWGATFTVAQLTFDLLSLACVLAAWLLARRLARPLPAMLATLGFALIGATNGGNFALFSLAIYTPAILFGAIGILLVCSGLVDTITKGLTPSGAAFLACGGFVGCLSRPECAAAIVSALLCLALVEFRSQGRVAYSGQLVPIAALLVGPSIFAYALLAAWIGAHPLIEGVTGYGQATMVCPWWPTGFGSVGGAAALGGAIAAFGVLESVVKWSGDKSFRPDLRRVLLAGAGAMCWAAYTYLFFDELTLQQGVQKGPLALAYFLVSANTFSLPVMWACYLMFIWEGFSYLGPKRERTAEEQVSFAMLGVVAAVATRGLFNSAHSHASLVSPIIYVLIFPMFPMLVRLMFSFLDRILPVSGSPVLTERAYAAAGIVLCLFGCIRIVGYGVKEVGKPYVQIDTDAGPVKFSDGLVSAQVYDFLKKNTLSGEPIADIAYGGGINFALHRSSPLYSTQFAILRPTAQHLERDYLQLRASNTRFVISPDPPAAHFGTSSGCAFPRFVWKTSPRADDEIPAFPVIQLILEQYRPSRRFGNVTIYSNEAQTGGQMTGVREGSQ